MSIPLRKPPTTTVAQAMLLHYRSSSDTILDQYNAGKITSEHFHRKMKRITDGIKFYEDAIANNRPDSDTTDSVPIGCPVDEDDEDDEDDDDMELDHDLG